MPVVQCFFSAARTKLHEKYDYPHLANAAELHPGNASRTYLEIERE